MHVHHIELVMIGDNASDRPRRRRTKETMGMEGHLNQLATSPCLAI